MGQLKLKDFIRAIRSCKTAADERAVIAKESAAIRTSFKEDSSIESRHINMAKLLYIHMLGHPAHFGQIECLKLVAGGKYADKRLGYLGIMLLLDESQEVLTLVTNSLKNDMNSSNMYTVGLALCTMGNICSAEMARDLSPEVDKLLASNNSYIKKKAVLCAFKALKKVPDLVEQFVAKAKMILNERNHAVLLTGMSLITEICLVSPEYLREFRSMISHLTRHLKSSLVAGSSPEHDVNGINDPFLQIKILRLMRVLGKGDRECSDAMNDILAQIATNTDGGKNVGNAILYETCLTIMEIEADSGLRVLAINILGRFLANPDNNIKYVALNTLSKTIAVDVNAVQRHRGTVLECLRDSDISIRRRALDLCFYLINESNVRMMIRELLVFLEVADTECKASMPSRICASADQFAPNKRWHIDTVIRVFKLAGNYVREDVLSNFIKIVASAPEFHTYACYKLFYSLKQDLSQESLILAGVWCIGEYGDSLLQSSPPNAFADDAESESPSNGLPAAGDEMIKNVSDKDVLDLLEGILESPYSSAMVTEYVLTALLKLTSRIANTSVVDRIKGIIGKYKTHVELETQQRSVEYSVLLTSAMDKHRAAVLERMPVPPPTMPSERKAISVAEQRPASSAGKVSASKAAGPASGNLLDDLLSLDLDANNTQPATFGANSSVGSGNNMDLLADVFGSVPTSTAAQPKAKNDILDLFGAAPTSNSTGMGMAGVMGMQSPLRSNIVPVASGLDLLGGFGTSAASTGVAAASSTANKYDVFAGLGDVPAKSPALTGVSPQPAQIPGFGVNNQLSSGFGQSTTISVSPVSSPADVIAYSKNGLQITMSPSLDSISDPVSRTCSVVAKFKNNSAAPISNLLFQVAVPKSLKLQLFPASTTTLQPNDNAKQDMKIQNPIGGTPEGQAVGIKLRLKISYTCSSGNVDEIVDFAGFPSFSW